MDYKVKILYILLFIFITIISLLFISEKFYINEFNEFNINNEDIVKDKWNDNKTGYLIGIIISLIILIIFVLFNNKYIDIIHNHRMDIVKIICIILLITVSFAGMIYLFKNINFLNFFIGITYLILCIIYLCEFIFIFNKSYNALNKTQYIFSRSLIYLSLFIILILILTFREKTSFFNNTSNKTKIYFLFCFLFVFIHIYYNFTYNVL